MLKWILMRLIHMDRTSICWRRTSHYYFWFLLSHASTGTERHRRKKRGGRWRWDKNNKSIDIHFGSGTWHTYVWKSAGNLRIFVNMRPRTDDDGVEECVTIKFIKLTSFNRTNRKYFAFRTNLANANDLWTVLQVTFQLLTMSTTQKNEFPSFSPNLFSSPRLNRVVCECVCRNQIFQ